MPNVNPVMHRLVSSREPTAMMDDIHYKINILPAFLVHHDVFHMSDFIGFHEPQGAQAVQ
nr:hypothetical protein [Candidatus Sigynarchaeum springense]